MIFDNIKSKEDFTAMLYEIANRADVKRRFNIPAGRVIRDPAKRFPNLANKHNGEQS